MDQCRALQLARRGEEEGFRWLFERYRDALYRIIHRTSNLDADSAKDVLQEVFIRAFNHLDGLREDARFEPWLVRIARRETLRWVGKKRPKGEGLDANLELACDRLETLAAARERERLFAMIREVAPTLEPAVVRDTALRYYLGPRCTTDQLARELGVPPAMVRKRLYLFRKKLRHRLAEAVKAGG